MWHGCIKGGKGKMMQNTRTHTPKLPTSECECYHALRKLSCLGQPKTILFKINHVYERKKLIQSCH